MNARVTTGPRQVRKRYNYRILINGASSGLFLGEYYQLSDDMADAVDRARRTMRRYDIAVSVTVSWHEPGPSVDGKQVEKFVVEPTPTAGHPEGAEHGHAT